MASLVERYVEQLKLLLPPGSAYNRDPDTVIEAVLGAIADELVAVHNRALDVIAESDPRTTDELIAGWERVLGLPDCGVLETTLEGRRTTVTSRLASIGGQSPQYFIGVAASAGFVVIIDEFRPFTVDGGHVDGPLYDENWWFTWRINAPKTTVTYFRAGIGRAGDPLSVFTEALLVCLIDQLKPAHTKVLYAYNLAEYETIAAALAGASELVIPAGSLDVATYGYPGVQSVILLPGGARHQTTVMDVTPGGANDVVTLTDPLPANAPSGSSVYVQEIPDPSGSGGGDGTGAGASYFDLAKTLNAVAVYDLSGTAGVITDITGNGHDLSKIGDPVVTSGVQLSGFTSFAAGQFASRDLFTAASSVSSIVMVVRYTELLDTRIASCGWKTLTENMLLSVRANRPDGGQTEFYAPGPENSNNPMLLGLAVTDVWFHLCIRLSGGVAFTHINGQGASDDTLTDASILNDLQQAVIRINKELDTIGGAAGVVTAGGFDIATLSLHGALTEADVANLAAAAGF